MWKKLKDWSELVTIPIGLLLWFLSPIALRLVDETAATFDAGIWQALLFAVVAVLVFSGVVRLIMKLQWSEIDFYLDQIFNDEIYHTTAWQRLKLSLSVFFLLLFALVILTQAVL